jgi:hypothetical protein
MPKLKSSGIMSGHDYDQAGIIMDPRYLYLKKDLDRDPATGVHCGVNVAVNQLFSDFHRAGAATASVWWASPKHYVGPIVDEPPES